jgi:protein-tyrosine kinase
MVKSETTLRLEQLDPSLRDAPAPATTPGTDPGSAGEGSLRRHRPPEVSAREVLRILFKHRTRMTWIAAGTLLLVVVATSARSPVYEARSTLMVRLGTGSVHLPEVGEQRPDISVTPEEALNSELQILTSDDLIAQTVEIITPDRLYPPLLRFLPRTTGPEAQKKLAEAISAEAIKRSNVLQVAFRHRDPAVAAEAVNVLVNLYLLREQRKELDTSYRLAAAKLGAMRRRSETLAREEMRTADVQKDVLQTRVAAKGLESRMASLRGLIGEIDQRIGRLGGSKRMYDSKAEELRPSSETNQQQLGDVSVIQAAAVPAIPVRPRFGVHLLVGAVLAALTGILYAFLAELAMQGMSTPESVERRLGLPVLATVPHRMGRGAGTSLTRAGESVPPGEGLVAEDEMLLLHHSLEARLFTTRRKILHFTASRRGEGTSSTARSFARALAGAIGRSVLLLDGGAPDPEQRPGPDVTGVGWRELLARGEAIGRAICPTALPGLSVSPSCARARVPPALDGEALDRLFTELRDRFDTVLLDASPAFGPDAMAISARSDGVVLVVEADRTRWPVALEARKRIEEGGGRVLGVVLDKRRSYVPERIYRWLWR